MTSGVAMAWRKKLADIAPPLVVGVLIIALWEAFCRGFSIPSYLFPAPSEIVTTFVTDAPALMRALWVTLRVTLIALALAIVIGSAIAFLFVQSPIIERSFFPYAVIMQVTPIVAIAPLIIILVHLWQSTGYGSMSSAACGSITSAPSAARSSTGLSAM